LKLKIGSVEVEGFCKGIWRGINEVVVGGWWTVSWWERDIKMFYGEEVNTS
jgi:hypothetical protein